MRFNHFIDLAVKINKRNIAFLTKRYNFSTFSVLQEPAQDLPDAPLPSLHEIKGEW